MVRVKVCDSIMGAGKTSASITYMNEHRQSKFIYVTPYLDEAKRIKKGCPRLRFTEPSDKLPEYHFKKTEHTAALIKAGQNITTTHQAFLLYTEEMLEDIRKQKYKIIIDESITTMERYDVSQSEIQFALDAGYIQLDNDSYKLVNQHYDGRWGKEFFEFLRHRDLIQVEDVSGVHLYYWLLPPDLLYAFEEVIVLTYLFEGQAMHHFFTVCNIPYEFIGVNKREDGKFDFGPFPGYIPEYVHELKEKIHIIDHRKLNAIGDDRYALSMNWFNKPDANTDKLTNHIFNYYNNILPKGTSTQRMIGTYRDAFKVTKGTGCTKACTTFNLRATNDYRERTYLAYIANIYMNVGEKLFYKAHGLEVDEDKYALSIMIQWIWRSAIRDGNEVTIYVPSERMRTLLVNWVNSFSDGGTQ